MDYQSLRHVSEFIKKKKLIIFVYLLVRFVKYPMIVYMKKTDLIISAYGLRWKLVELKFFY